MTFSVGNRVHFNTAGRYPAPQKGVIQTLDLQRPLTGWAEILCDDGVVRKARPKSLKHH